MESELLRYERLAEDLSGFIVAGNLRPGERLPSVRRLSRERRLSVSTVLQALHQLEDRGLVEARPQSGYFVRHAAARRAQPSARSTPEAPVPVDVSQRLMRVLQSGVQPGVAPGGRPAGVQSDAAGRPAAALRQRRAAPSRLLEGGSHINIDEPALIRQLVLRSVGWAGRAVGERVRDHQLLHRGPRALPAGSDPPRRYGRRRIARLLPDAAAARVPRPARHSRYPPIRAAACRSRRSIWPPARERSPPACWSPTPATPSAASCPTRTSAGSPS
jgi:DNA-binding transcriptional regulator YhcF (GntR family)